MTPSCLSNTCSYMERYICGTRVSFGNGHVKDSIILSSLMGKKGEKEVVFIWWCAYERMFLDSEVKVNML